MANAAPVIVWFRQDLRLTDNPALQAAHESGRSILPVYCLDDEAAGDWQRGAASRWWLHQSLLDLNQRLGNKMHFTVGEAREEIAALAKEIGAEGVFWNRCYEPWRMARDAEIKASLKACGINAQSFNGSLLFEPHVIKKKDGTPYKVFTPFFRRGCLEASPPREPLPAPSKLLLANHPGAALDDLQLFPTINWVDEMTASWQPGEEGAARRLAEFLETGLNGYKDGRNEPSKPHVSRLSPHLHFGEISPNIAWYAAERAMDEQNCERDGDHFRSELAWREFSHALLFYNHDLPTNNLQSRFDPFPWREDPVGLAAWQRGMTGVPIVDAGMRELWQTGYMHNRVRMIVGSFLVKNLLIHWHHGEKWFWDTLVDADLANNSASWQWIAGCGADAAPYFRIFNPVTQGQRFDADGAYVRRYVPEIAELPDKYLHSPWTTPEGVLKMASIELGTTYPNPIIDLKASRERALAAFQSLRGKEVP